MKFECTKCSLFKYKGPLSGEGPVPNDLMIVGQVPTLIDADKEKLFVGKVGEQLNIALANAAISRDQVYITNVIKCYVPSNKTITKTQILKCGSIHLEEEIKKVQPKVILVLGNIASKYFGKKFIVNSYFYSDKYQCYIVITYHPMKFIFTYDDELFNTFKQGFIIAKDLLEKDPKKQKNIPSKVIKDYITLKDLQPLGDTFALDLETTGVEFYKNDIVTIGLSNGNYTLGCPFQKNKEILTNFLVNKKIIGSNIKFDYKFLRKNGIKINIYFDDMLAHSLIDPIAPHNLKAMSLKYLHTKLSKGEIDFDNTNIADIDYNQWSNYVANDAWMTYKLYEIFKPLIDKEFTTVFYKVVIPTTKWLAEAEFRGIKVDRDYIKKEMTAIEYKLKEIENKLNNLQVIKDFKANQGLETFNIMSPTQISKLLYKFLGLEGKGTGESVLTNLAKNPKLSFLKDILEYRQLSKGYKTYLLNLYEDSKYDGRIHTTYSQITIASGRIASKRPNLQNIPKSSNISTIVRRAFVASPGYTLLEADYSQAEFRIFAHLSRDQKMIELINSDKDIHKIMASVAYMKPESEITDKERTLAKTLTFGILYGRGVKSIAEQLETSYEEALNVKKTITEVFKEASKWIDKVQDFAKHHGYVKTMTGRKIILHGVYSKDPDRVAYDLRRAVNQPVQGGAADLTNLAGYYVMKEFQDKNLDAFILLNVHDAIYVECKDEIVPEIKELITRIMTKEVPAFLNLRVKLKIDIKQGKSLLFK